MHLRLTGSAGARAAAPGRRCRLVSARAGVYGGKVYIDPVKQECTAFAPATVANLGPGFDWLGCAVSVRGGGPHAMREHAHCRGVAIIEFGPRDRSGAAASWARDAAQRAAGGSPPVRCVPLALRPALVCAPRPPRQGDGDTVTARVLPGEPGKVVIESITGDGGRLSLSAADNCIGIAAIETLKLLGQPSCGIALTLNKVRVHAGVVAACAALDSWGTAHARRSGISTR